MNDAGDTRTGGVVRRTTSVETRIDRDRGVFMISVAAELAEMHPQTLRMYEARGLVQPQRSPKNTRLYSHEDVERLRRIQAMTAEQGLNLAGVETVLELEERLEEMRTQLRRMRERTAEMEQRMADEIAAGTALARGRADPLRRLRGEARGRAAGPGPGPGRSRLRPVELTTAGAEQAHQRAKPRSEIVPFWPSRVLWSCALRSRPRIPL